MAARKSRKTYLSRGVATPGAVLAVVLATGLLAGCENLADAPPQPPPTIALHGVILHHYDENGLAALGHAADASFRRDSGQLSGQTLVVDLPPSARIGRGGVRINAGRGDGDVHGKRAHASGGVDATSALGDHATSEEATYSEKDDSLWALRPLHADGPGYVLDGRTWMMHVRSRELSLADDVHARTREGTP